jgi:malate dehydrogenase (oxaloacetate-decarboxylating)
MSLLLCFGKIWQYSSSAVDIFLGCSAAQGFMTQLTPTSSFSLKIRIKGANRPGMLAAVVEAIAQAKGSLGDITLVEQNLQESVRDICVDSTSAEHAAEIEQGVRQVPGVEVLMAEDRTFLLHRGGKITVESRIAVANQSDLAMVYTPGVGRICRAIAEHPEEVYRLTIKQNMVAIVTDGSAILGLGNLGPEAALPVMEGKALLFKEFAGVDAFPICLATQDTDEIVNTVKYLTPVFGGVNLEDIAAPRCFEIERRLREETDIPIFHDDQHGTAIVVLAALTNGLRLVAKPMEEIRIVVNGAGAAGIAIAQLLQAAGATQIILCDSQGILSQSRTDLNATKQAWVVEESGQLGDAMARADVFIGVSAPGVLTSAMVKSMADRPIVFAMANPIPEIQPELVRDHVAVIATGRSDYPNQINNVLAFPGLFRGALDCRASALTQRMYLEAAKAIASLVAADELNAEYIVPSAFDRRVAPAVAAAVQMAAALDGVARC